MDTSELKSFAKAARVSLIEQVSSKLYQVLKAESQERRESPYIVAKLEAELKSKGEEQLIDQVAYTWFNRFCALRFMDVNRYNRIAVVSPIEGQVQPEILAEAKAGHLDESVVKSTQIRERIHGLINGSVTSRDGQVEAYRLLIVSACNSYNSSMPFLFEQIQDYTELLMPDDLLSENSILADTRQAMTKESCENVEVIGWLYQFYISEKKDDVFAALKKGKKITAENIPAATQLFTPHWIVRYLVENSLGRLWMLNHPESRLIERMDYYIKPQEPETDFLRIENPEDIKICDPACGSGHMLTYAFELMYAIYEEAGKQANEIPQLILTHNLFGIEIDQRAGALAAFALTMKAREKYRRFLSSGKAVQPNICVLENIHVETQELNAYMDVVGRDLFSNDLEVLVNQWKETDSLGSLIQPVVANVSELLELLNVRGVGQDLLLASVHEKILKVLMQADYLNPKYHIVVANPPYMGGKGMSVNLKAFAKSKYPSFKSDLYSMFIKKAWSLVVGGGSCALITIQGWLYAGSSHELRKFIIKSCALRSLVHIGFNSFPELNSKYAVAVMFTFDKLSDVNAPAKFIDLNSASKSADKRNVFFERNNSKHSYQRYPSDFLKLPVAPFAYSVPSRVIQLFSEQQPYSSIGKAKSGLQTGDNEQFLRFWFELSRRNITLDYLNDKTSSRWVGHAKGGSYRRWYGNLEYCVDWENAGDEIIAHPSSRPQNREMYFQPGVSWSHTGLYFGARILPPGIIFNVEAPTFFSDVDDLLILGALNSRVTTQIFQDIYQSLHFLAGDVMNLPYLKLNLLDSSKLKANVARCIAISKEDWDSNETSLDFASNSLVALNTGNRLENSLGSWNKECTLKIESLKFLEESNNQLFATTFGLSDEFQNEVASDEITLLRGSIEEGFSNLISYAVGCMFGRYSLDKDGLILASQGDDLERYKQLIPESAFSPDEENVIPLLEGDWFTDDISERFKKFLKVTFGTTHFEENLTFLENGLYPENRNGKKRKTIRDYFLKDFYNHHVKLYKKRPIYWLFSSPKGTFNALIYMHRYRPDTVSVVLNSYLREFQIKLQAKKDSLEQMDISASASPREKTQALKEISQLNKMLKELKDYEHDVLYPLATQNIEIDLDDGVKANYPKFGSALKKITGLS